MGGSEKGKEYDRNDLSRLKKKNNSLLLKQFFNKRFPSKLT